LAYFSTRSTSDILEREINKRAEALAMSTAKFAEYPMFSNDKNTLAEYTRGLLDRADVAYVYFRNSKTGQIVVRGANDADEATAQKEKKQPAGGTTIMVEDYIGSSKMKDVFSEYLLPLDKSAQTRSWQRDGGALGRILNISVPMTFRPSKDDAVPFFN